MIWETEGMLCLRKKHFWNFLEQRSCRSTICSQQDIPEIPAVKLLVKLLSSISSINMENKFLNRIFKKAFGFCNLNQVNVEIVCFFQASSIVLPCIQGEAQSCLFLKRTLPVQSLLQKKVVFYYLNITFKHFSSGMISWYRLLSSLCFSVIGIYTADYKIWIHINKLVTEMWIM